MAKHNVKKRSFQKECWAVNWDSVIILLLVLQLKYTSLSIHLWVYSWNKVSLPHQEYSKDDEIQEWLEIGDMVSNDRIVAIAAENSPINNVWFVHVIDIKCVDHSTNKI